MYDMPPPPPPAYHLEETVPVKQAAFQNNSKTANALRAANEKIEIPYSELRRTDEDQSKIVDIISTMATNGKVSLLLRHKKRLEKMGDELNIIHPFKFLAYIYNQPTLKQYLGDIFEDYFKRTNFTAKLYKRINAEHKKGTTIKYAEGFAEETNLPVEHIRSFIERKNWNGLLKYLITS